MYILVFINQDIYTHKFHHKFLHTVDILSAYCLKVDEVSTYKLIANGRIKFFVLLVQASKIMFAKLP